MGALDLKAIRKSFGATDVIRGVDLEVAPGEFTVFVGPSGCGKSTLLRIIAGLEDQTSGDLSIAGQLMNGVPPARRGIAMVFQSYALYPHLTVEGNMGLALKQEGVERSVIAARIARASALLQLDPLLARRPAELSGGQRQRVAIGRAIVREPKLFLFDEPLSNLDAALRVGTRLEIAKLHRQLGATMVYVTHDQVEAMTLADKIVVLRAGVVEQVGSPLDLYRRPANRFVAGLHRLAGDELRRGRGRGPRRGRGDRDQARAPRGVAGRRLGRDGLACRAPRLRHHALRRRARPRPDDGTDRRRGGPPCRHPHRPHAP